MMLGSALVVWFNLFFGYVVVVFGGVGEVGIVATNLNRLPLRFTSCIIDVG